MAHQTDLFPPPPPGVEDTGIVDVFSDQAGYRNLIFSINADWSDTGNDWTIASRVHEMSHIIEFNYDGIYGLPNWTDEAWGDSQFAGLFE